MISFRPSINALRKALKVPPADIEAAAVESWVIGPAITRYIPPATFLPGHLDRVRAAEFGSVADVVRDFTGGYDAVQPETLGFRFRDVDLVDGVLYAPGAERHLRRRQRRLPAYTVPAEVTSGALYESSVGNRWFGNWLTDDCLTYELAERFGAPVTTSMDPRGHVPSYEVRLGLRPKRISRAHFDELILFRDSSHNDDRKARADRCRERLAGAAQAGRHAGVFLLRGSTGERRVLLNEAEIAEKLASRWGFRVLDPSSSELEAIVDACAGASVVAGVEGSHLVHGLVAMPTDATLFVLQPAERVVSVLKIVTDRQGQGFALIIGSAGRDQFVVDWSDVARTMEMVLG